MCWQWLDKKIILSHSLSCSIKRSQSGRCLVFYRGEGSRKWEFVKKKAGGWPRVSIEKGMGTHSCAHTNPHTQTLGHRAQSWWIIPLGCWEISYSEVIQLWHHGSALCVIRFTIMSNMQEVTWLRNYTTPWNTCSDARQTKLTALEILLQTTCNWAQGHSNHLTLQ